jgi:hypothetical protein
VAHLPQASSGLWHFYHRDGKIAAAVDLQVNIANKFIVLKMNKKAIFQRSLV